MKNLYLILLLALTLVGCTKSADDPTQNAGKVDDPIYMSLQLSAATTRSQTDDSGTTNSNADPDYEVGTDAENKISKVDIALVKKNADGSVAKTITATVTPDRADTDEYIAMFDNDQLEEGAQYDVYIYANAAYQSNLDAVYSLTSDNLTDKGGIAADGNFLMTNAYNAATITLPNDLSAYTYKTNPLSLGTHYVERAVARFDYKSVNDNTYTMMENANKEATIQLQLTDVALINMSKSFYYLRRTSANGTEANWDIGGVETPYNYVVDTDWNAKRAGTVTPNSFLYHMGTDNSTWEWTKISSLTKNDNYTGNTGSNTASNSGADNGNVNSNVNTGNYKVWRYATENTIAQATDGTDSNQINGNSTGVVFKGKLVATDKADANIKEAMKARNNIYVYNNILYGNWADVKTAAAAVYPKDHEYAGDLVNPRLAAAVNKTTVVTGKTEPTLANAAAAGFAVYSANNNGDYEMIYYYWNRHNDNLNNDKMGKMEFAVVRNNVYKIAVTAINRFGHPTNPEGDPDKPEYDDPDEDPDYYFSVAVKVLPWVVRINNIEF